MTNEDIATKFHDEVESLKGHTCYHHLGTYSDGVYNGALVMAEWKDNQFKTELNRLRNRFNGEESHRAYFALETLNELYNTFFQNDIQPA